jgi:putative nucleotidyltransferase with HDIG domain
MRLPPTNHGDGDNGFMATLVAIARDKGVSGYIGDGANRWPAVHRLDSARLFRLAVESAPAGSTLHEFWAQLETPDVSRWEPPEVAIAADDARLDRIAEAFARVIDAKSPFTARHAERVAEIADGIAAVLGFDSGERRVMRRAALLHDIGKLAVSNRILDKPGRLNAEEFRAVQTHPAHTLSILERAPCFAELADLAANHHEKLDGSGYPRSLGAGDLDLPMRVLAVADVYEALTADRPYRGPLPLEQALAIIDRDVPHRLDAGVRAALEIHLGRASAEPERSMLRRAA